MALPVLVGEKHFTSSGTNIVSITHELAIQENDVVVLVVNANSTITATDSNGATPLTKDFEAGYSTATVSIFSRVAGASEPLTYSVGLSTSQRLSASLLVYRGVDSSIYDVAPMLANLAEGENSHPTLSGITTLSNDALVLMAVGNDSTASVGWPTFTNGFSKVSGAESNYNASAVAGKVLSTAGAVGETIANQSQIGLHLDWYAIQFSLKAAPSGPIITNIDGDNTVTPNQTAVITMSGGADTAATATFGGVACTFTGSATETTRPVIIPDSLPYGTHDLVVDGTITLAGVTLEPDASKQVVIVADVNLSDNSLFYNSNLPVEDGWQWELPTLTNEGKVIAPHPSGTVVIENTGAEAQTFDYRVYDFTTGAWSEYATATITPTADNAVVINIDGDNVVYPNQTATIHMTADGDTATTVTLGGSACTLTGTATATTRPVIIPTDLPYGLHQLIVETA